jgi:preprotein translocase SecE subunit
LNTVKSFFSSVKSFFSEVKAELGKVTWIGSDEFIGQMVVVCITIAFMSIVLGFMDAAFGEVLRKLLS